MKKRLSYGVLALSVGTAATAYSWAVDAQSPEEDQPVVVRPAETLAQAPVAAAIQTQGSGPEQGTGQASPAATTAETNAQANPAPINGGADAPPPPPSPAVDAEAGSNQPAGIETVVVTARRSAENIQKVPVAVTAFSAKDLEKQQITSPQDLNGIVPSLSIGTGSTTRNAEMPTLRGQGANISASPGVIMYYGEVPLPSDIFFTSQGGPGKFFDLSDLQVLKGSQGTLFGRNTTGGAIVMEPHKPDTFLDWSIKSEMSNLQGKGAEGYLNLPLVDDRLYLRVGAKYYENDGFTKDIVNNQNLDNQGYRTMRLGLMWKPTDSIENYTLGYYTRSANGGTSEVLQQINNSVAGCLAVDAAAFVAGLGNTHCGQTVVAEQQARGVRSVALDTAPDDLLDTDGVIDNFSYRLSNYDLTLRNIASYQFLKHHYRWDQDGSILPLDAFVAPDTVNVSDMEQFTDEIQAQGDAFNSDLKYTTGIYYQYIEPEGPNRNVASQFALVNTQVNYNIDTRSYGPYVQTTYDMGGLFKALDGLNLTTGFRYSWDDVSGSIQSGIYGPGGSLIAGDQQPVYSEVKNSAPTYTAGFDYKVPTTLLYAKISRGYKSGGISPQAVTPSRYTFKPEFVFNYEVGAKSDFMLGPIPLRMDSALYYTDYTDIQKTATDNNGIQFGAATVNAAKASIEGFETEITIQPLEGLTVLASYSYTYGKYDQFSIQLATLTPQPDCTGVEHKNGDMIDLQCVPMTYIPRHQGSLTTRYQLPVSESLGTMDGSVTFSYIDRQYSSQLTVPDAEPGAWLGGYGLLNASLNWSSIYHSAFDLQLFGANLTDRTYRVSNSNIWSFLYFQSSIYGEPRTFGASLAYRWGK